MWDPQWDALQVAAQAQGRFAGARCVLSEVPDHAAAEDWLLRVRRAFWTEAGTEASEGNEEFAA
jgi:uncharacterized protein